MYEVEGRIFQAQRWALEDQPEKKAHAKIRKQKAWVVVGISTDIWSLSAWSYMFKSDLGQSCPKVITVEQLLGGLCEMT